MKVKIILKFNQTKQEHALIIGKPVIIGRSSRSDYKVDDEKMSGSHCQINLKYDRLEITDLDSKNGVYLNGIRVEHSEVFAGDEIKIGNTLITLEEKSMDQEALRLLTFPGPFNDRLAYELKADFTGARIQNQLVSSRVKEISREQLGDFRAKEVALRRKIKSRIKLSKHEIRARYKIKALSASLLDALFFFFVLAIPLILIESFLPSETTNENKAYALLAFEILFASTFFLANFKISRFTFGERFAGIEKLYLQQ